MVTIRTTRFNTQQLYVLPTQYICAFCVDLRTNSDYFPHTTLTFGLYNRDSCLRTETFKHYSAFVLKITRLLRQLIKTARNLWLCPDARTGFFPHSKPQDDESFEVSSRHYGDQAEAPRCETNSSKVFPKSKML